jgi:hypothetical protein
MTSAVWKDEEAFQNARKNTAEVFEEGRLNPAEIMRYLNVAIESVVYRHSYLRAVGAHAHTSSCGITPTTRNDACEQKTLKGPRAASSDCVALLSFCSTVCLATEY